MNNVWVIFEINYITNMERMSSIHDSEEVAHQISEYYQSLLPNNSGIEYKIQNWTVVKDLKTITDVEVVNMHEEQKNLIN